MAYETEDVGSPHSAEAESAPGSAITSKGSSGDGHFDSRSRSWSDASGSGSGSDSGSNPYRHRLDILDVEASESGSESSLGDDRGRHRGRRRSSQSLTDSATFHPFRRLPVELRGCIWEFFCPDLLGGPRYLQFRASCGSRSTNIELDEITEQMMDPLTAVLATHRESRHMALRVFPDTLEIRRGRSLLRFSKERDVIHIQIPSTYPGEVFRPVSGFTDQVCHLAIQPLFTFDRSGHMLGEIIEKTLHLQYLLYFPKLESLYITTSSSDVRSKYLRWCASPLTNRYHVRTCEIEPGLGEDFQAMYCWPTGRSSDRAEPTDARGDLDKHTDDQSVTDEQSTKQSPFEQSIPYDKLSVAKNALRDVASEITRIERLDHSRIKMLSRLGKVELWPLIVFEFDGGVSLFDELCRKEAHIWRSQNSLESGSGSESESESEPPAGAETDEYESEGIDDDEIEEATGDDDDDDDDDLLISGDQSETANGPDAAGMETDSNLAPAHFSSPEPGSAASDVSSAPRTSVHVARRPKRRIVSDSDSDDNSGDDVETRRPAKRRRAPVAEPDSDEDSETLGGVQSEPEDESEQDDDDEEGGDDEEGDARGRDKERHMSLAERLELHRRENPLPSSDGDGSGSERSVGDYDMRQYGDSDESETGEPYNDDDVDGTPPGYRCL